MTDNRPLSQTSPQRGRQDEAPPIDSRSLFAERSEIRILHEGQIYRLRATKNGKLVMNK